MISKENAWKLYQIRTTKSDKLRNKRLYGDKKGNGKLPEKWLKYLMSVVIPVKKYEKVSGNKPIVGIIVNKIYGNILDSIYDMGYERTGCMFCMFGVHLEKGNENRFQRLKRTHPVQYEYCINKLGCGKVLDYIGVQY